MTRKTVDWSVKTEIFIKSRNLPSEMNPSLETRVSHGSLFKSTGERKIAVVLSKYGIPFNYESAIVVQDEQHKPRIWYPDFCLPTFGIYVEFYGHTGDPSYDSFRTKKEQVYKDVGVEVIAIDPSVPEHRLDSFLINQIYRVQARRYEGIKSKVYDLRTGTRQRY